MNTTEWLDRQRLADATFVVIDFETVTPAGRPPEPIELAALRVTPGLQIDQQFRANWLMQPPRDAPLTAFDTRQTGIHWDDLCDQPDATTVLQECDVLFQREPAILVAHNASYEANIIWRFAHVCPTLAALPFIDTIALAKQVIPTLDSYRLDVLAQHFSLPIPHNRHRAMPDVQLTIQIFLRLVHHLLDKKPVTTIADLRQVAGIARKSQSAAQMRLFEGVE